MIEIRGDGFVCVEKVGIIKGRITQIIHKDKDGKIISTKGRSDLPISVPLVNGMYNLRLERTDWPKGRLRRAWYWLCHPGETGTQYVAMEVCEYKIGAVLEIECTPVYTKTRMNVHKPENMKAVSYPEGMLHGVPKI